MPVPVSPGLAVPTANTGLYEYTRTHVAYVQN